MHPEVPLVGRQFPARTHYTHTATASPPAIPFHTAHSPTTISHALAQPDTVPTPSTPYNTSSHTAPFTMPHATNTSATGQTSITSLALRAADEASQTSSTTQTPSSAPYPRALTPRKSESLACSLALPPLSLARHFDCLLLYTAYALDFLNTPTIYSSL